MSKASKLGKVGLMSVSALTAGEVSAEVFNGRGKSIGY